MRLIDAYVAFGSILVKQLYTWHAGKWIITIEWLNLNPERQV